MAALAEVPVSEFQPRKAEKSRVKLKIAVQGPSGAGKTYSALALARNMWPDAKICVIDTENESSALYADKWDFDYIPLHPPFTTARYIAAIDAALRSGVDVLVIDSISPQWDGEGGILRRKEELDKRPGSNSYANWASFTPEHEQFKQKLVHSPVHLIATMRSKQEYALEKDDRGKTKPVKMGLAPIQRDGMDFEFSQVWDIQMDHKASTSKDRTALFDGKIVNLADPELGVTLRGWLDNGKPQPQVVPTQPQAAQQQPQAQSQPKTQVATKPEPKNEAPKLDPHFAPKMFDGMRLMCQVSEILERKTKDDKKQDYVALVLSPPFEAHKMLFCFHQSLFEALKTSVGQICRFEVMDGGKGTLSISNITWIGEQPYKDGRPELVQPEPSADGGADAAVPF